MDIDNFEFRPLTEGLGFDKTTDQGEPKPLAFDGSSPSSPHREARGPLQREALKERDLSGDKPPSRLSKNHFQLAHQDFVKTHAPPAIDPPQAKPPEELHPPPQTPVSRSLKKMLDSLPPSVDLIPQREPEESLHGPVHPHKDTHPQKKGGLYSPASGGRVQEPSPPSTQPDFDVTLDNSLSQAFPKEEVTKRFYHQMVTPKPQFKEVSTSLASAIIDAAVVFSLAVVFIITLILLTGVNFETMLFSAQYGLRTQVELAFLAGGINSFYFMISRGLFGCSVGEYAFDIQLGSTEQRAHLMYPFQVLFRSLMMTLTGLCLIPLVSLGFGKDMGYYFSGLKLYSRQY